MDEFKRDSVRLVTEERYTFKAAATAVGVSEKGVRDRTRNRSKPESTQVLARKSEISPPRFERGAFGFGCRRFRTNQNQEFLNVFATWNASLGNATGSRFSGYFHPSASCRDKSPVQDGPKRLGFRLQSIKYKEHRYFKEPKSDNVRKTTKRAQ